MVNLERLMTFEQRVVYAVERLNDGEPINDHLDDDEIEDALRKLARIYETSEALYDKWSKI